MLTVTLSCRPRGPSTRVFATASRALRHLQQKGRRNIGQHYGEFLAAKTRNQVDGAKTICNFFRYRLQHEITDRMTMLVVDLFEVIDIDDQEAETLGGPRAAVDFASERVVENAAVRQPRQTVMRRQQAQPVDHVLQARDLVRTRQRRAIQSKQTQSLAQIDCASARRRMRSDHRIFAHRWRRLLPPQRRRDRHFKFYQTAGWRHATPNQGKPLFKG